jgi:hypothetical protein
MLKSSPAAESSRVLQHNPPNNGHLANGAKGHFLPQAPAAKMQEGQ